MNTEQDLIVNEFEKVKIIIAGKEFEIKKKLSLGQYLKLSNLMTKFIQKNADRFKNIKTDGKTIFDDIIFIFDLLDSNEIGDVISLILCSDNKEFCCNVAESGEDLSELVAFVCENNDLGKVLKNVQRIAKIIPKSPTLPSQVMN